MYLFFSFLAATLSYKLFKKTGADMNPRGLNMLSWIYYVQFLCMSLVGVTISVYGLDNHYVISSISDQSIRVWGWMAVVYSILVFPCAILLVKIFFMKKYKFIPLVDKANIKIKNYPFLYILTFLSVIACLYVIILSKRIGILNLIFGNASMADRISYNRDFQGNIYIKNIFANSLSILLSMVWYLRWKIRKTTKNFCYFVIILLCAIVMVTQDYSKAPIFNMIISYAILWVYVHGRMRAKYFLLLLFLSVSLLVLMYFATSGLDLSQIFKAYNTGIIGRVFFSQISGLFKAIEFFPSYHEYVGFSSISRFISAMFNIEYSERSARIVMMLYNPKGVEVDLAGVMNSLFIAEAWANWGIIGAILSPWIAGLVTGYIYYYTMTRKDPAYGALYAYLSVLIPISGGFNDFIYPIGILLPFIFTWLIVSLSIPKNYSGPIVKTEFHPN